MMKQGKKARGARRVAKDKHCVQDLTVSVVSFVSTVGMAPKQGGVAGLWYGRRARWGL